MANATDSPLPAENVPAALPDQAVRPLGTWLVAAFLVLSTLVLWGLVSVIFHARS